MITKQKIIFIIIILLLLVSSAVIDGYRLKEFSNKLEAKQEELDRVQKYYKAAMYTIEFMKSNNVVNNNNIAQQQEEESILAHETATAKDSNIITAKDSNIITAKCRIESFKVLYHTARRIILYDYATENNFMLTISNRDYLTLIEGDDINITYNKDNESLISWEYVSSEDYCFSD